MSNFAKAGYKSKHNLKYWRGESVAALGPSATGFLQFENEGLRYKWKTSNIPEFSTEIVSKSSYKLERFFLHLRTSDGVNLYDFIDLDRIFEAEEFVRELNDHGHLANSSMGLLQLSPSGFLCADSITTRLASYF